jgi:putative DNA primase/helicase
LIGSKRRAVPYQGSSWEEPSILWLGLVGDPSHNKSPALDPMQNILRKLEDEETDEHAAQLNIWRADCERAKVESAQWQEAVKAAAKDGISTPPLPANACEPAAPRRRRFVVQDATPESLGGILVGNPEGTLMMRDELAGWLETFDRYNTGGRAYWLEAYGGRPYTIDRKQSPDPMRIPYNGVNVIGGIQPGKLADTLLSVTDDGLSARILFVWPDRRPWSRPTSTADLSGFEAAARRLEGLSWEAGEGRLPVRVLLSADAADVFDRCQRFYRDQELEACGLLKSFTGKLSGLTLRLALAVEFGRWAYEGGSEPSSISAQTMEAVGDFVAGYVLPMAERVYGDAALPIVERNAATLAKHIKRKRLRTINARDLMREERLPGLREAATVDPALEALIEAGWLKLTPSRSGDSVGRAKRDYAVNPAIWRAE